MIFYNFIESEKQNCLLCSNSKILSHIFYLLCLKFKTSFWQTNKIFCPKQCFLICSGILSSIKIIFHHSEKRIFENIIENFKGTLITNLSIYLISNTSTLGKKIDTYIIMKEVLHDLLLSYFIQNALYW